MKWGHKVISKEGQIEVTRAEYNEAFGVESPEPPALPDAVIHVWEWWWQLNARRSSGFESLPPLSYSEIHHWSTLTRTQILPIEISIIVKLDDAYLRAIATERSEQRDREKST
jgi:hypothetical protein